MRNAWWQKVATIVEKRLEHLGRHLFAIFGWRQSGRCTTVNQELINRINCRVYNDDLPHSPTAAQFGVRNLHIGKNIYKNLEPYTCIRMRTTFASETYLYQLHHIKYE